jgi:hypothetical protein
MPLMLKKVRKVRKVQQNLSRLEQRLKGMAAVDQSFINEVSFVVDAVNVAAGQIQRAIAVIHAEMLVEKARRVKKVRPGLSRLERTLKAVAAADYRYSYRYPLSLCHTLRNAG